MPRSRARPAAALALGPIVAAIGCGGSSSSDMNAEAPRPAAQIVNDAAAAFKRVHSVHIQGAEAVGKNPTAIKADIEPPGKLSLSLDQHGATAAVIAVDGSVYIKANAAYWKRQKVGRAAAAVADKWLQSPISSAQFRDVTKGLDVATLSHCLATDHGTLSRAGNATVAGQPAVVVVDKGDNPGGTPAKLFVAARGEPLPLRIVATGNERPGGKKDPQCKSSGSRGRIGDELTFSKYNEKLNIAAPPGAIDLTQKSTPQ